MSSASGNKAFLTIAPAVGIAISYFCVPIITNLDSDILEKIPFVPYLIILGVLAMGGFFSRHRVTFISAVIGIAYLAIHNIVSAGEITDNGQIIIGLVTVLLPLNIALLSGLKEQQLLSIQSFIAIAGISSQLLFSYWGIQNYPNLVALFVLFTPDALVGVLPVQMSLTALVSVVISLVLLVSHVFRKGTVFEFSFTGALIAVCFYLFDGSYEAANSIYIVTASLIMAWGLIHNSYLIAYIDELTELPGRRAMNEETGRLRGLYAIAMLDIDHFKKFNDTYGHDVGDQVLRMVASKIGKIGGGGKAFRYGGEEFSIIFPGKDSKAAFPYLSNLRETIDSTSLILRNQDRPSSKPEKIPPRKIPWQEVHVTISIGVADSGDELNTVDEILKAADEALYRSKEKGRNRISQYATKDYVPDLDVDEDEA